MDHSARSDDAGDVDRADEALLPNSTTALEAAAPSPGGLFAGVNVAGESQRKVVILQSFLAHGGRA
jgi:hypothetical protein